MAFTFCCNVNNLGLFSVLIILFNVTSLGLSISEDELAKQKYEDFKSSKMSQSNLDDKTKSNWFGYTGDFFPVHEFSSFPSYSDFFYNFVFRSIPVNIKGGDSSPAQTKWTDDYFLSKKIAADHVVNVETLTKDGAKQKVIQMHLQEYLRIYNRSDLYWVQPVPEVFLNDLVLPDPIQCSLLNDSYISHHIWFSSGGTKSSVHTDSADNIICLYRGSKDVILVDPYIYGDQVDMDHPERAFSGVDVDNVNYTTYPGLLNVEYHFVRMEKGDCLYIPFNWIHQIRSTGPNIAVSMWWNHHKNYKIDISQCSNEPTQDMTLDKVPFLDYDERNKKPEFMQEQLLFFSRTTLNSNFENMCKMLIVNSGDLEPEELETLKSPLRKLFATLDKNEDGQLKRREVLDATQQDWDDVMESVRQFVSIFADILIEQDRNPPEEPEESQQVPEIHDEF